MSGDVRKAGTAEGVVNRVQNGRSEPVVFAAGELIWKQKEGAFAERGASGRSSGGGCIVGGLLLVGESEYGMAGRRSGRGAMGGVGRRRDCWFRWAKVW